MRLTDEQRTLVEENMKFVYHIIVQDYPSLVGDADIIQSGMMGLCIAASKYNEDRGKFATYATHWVHGQIREELSRRNKQTNVEFISLEHPIGEDITLEDALEGGDDIEIDETNFTDILTENERIVLHLKYNGYTIKNISEITNFSIPKVRSLLRKIRIKYKKTHQIV